MERSELEEIRQRWDVGYAICQADVIRMLADLERAWACLYGMEAGAGSDPTGKLCADLLRTALTGPPAGPGGEDGVGIPPEACSTCGGSGIHANPIARRAVCPKCFGTGHRMPPETQGGATT